MDTNILDLSAFDCWIVYMLPCDDPKKNKDLQDECKEKGIFGIGWGCDASGYEKGDELTNVQTYVDAWIKKEKERNKSKEKKENDGNEEKNEVRGGPKKALENMLKIKENDYVIMRFLDGKFYVGRIKKEDGKTCYYIHSSSENDLLHNLSWGCRVGEWRISSSEEDVPPEIRGRFSQSFHQTIQKVSSYRLKILIAAMYDRMKNQKTDMPVILYTEQTFSRSMHYMQLEDLVYLYISKKIGENYLFIPSSGKVNRLNYEFSWVNEQNTYITCQVKNQEAIDKERIKFYTEDEAYKEIYVFSGKWTQEESEKWKKHCAEINSRVKIITRKELFDFLVELPGRERKLFENAYCEIKKDSEGYPSVEDIQSKCEGIKGLKLTKDEDGILHFNAKWNLIYAPEVGRILQINPDDDNGKIAKTKELLQQALKNEG